MTKSSSVINFWNLVPGCDVILLNYRATSRYDFMISIEILHHPTGKPVITLIERKLTQISHLRNEHVSRDLRL